MSHHVDEKVAFLRKTFGSCDVSRDGRNVGVPCPKCHDTQKKKLAIRLHDDVVNCWVCGLSGRLIKVLKQYKHSAVRQYIVQFAASRIDLLIDLPIREPLKLPAGFQLLAVRTRSRDPDVRIAIQYLKSRGLTTSDLWYYKFGISTEYELRRRVIMPSFDAAGDLNFYTGRAIDADAYRKYWNSDVEKKTIVFNELNIDWTKEVTLIEGPFDLVKCDSNAVPLLGSSLTEDSLLFGRIYQNKTPVLLALDSDMQLKMWQRIAKLLSSYDIPVKILPLGAFKDVGEMTKQQFIDARARAVSWDRTQALRVRIGAIGS